MSSSILLYTLQVYQGLRSGSLRSRWASMLARSRLILLLSALTNEPESWLLVSLSLKCTSVKAPTLTSFSWVSYPRSWQTRILADGSRVSSVNLPSISAVRPIVVPLKYIPAKGMGSPVSSSTTVPRTLVTAAFCAPSDRAPSSRERVINNNRFIKGCKDSYFGNNPKTAEPEPDIAA